MKKRKILAMMLAVMMVGLIVLSAPGQVKAAGGNYTVQRLGGFDQFDTANLVADEFANGNQVNTVILATSITFPDAIAASSLTKLYNAPILLTEPAKLNIKTEAEMKKLGIKKVIIVGGTAVVSQAVQNYLVNTLKMSVDRIGGYDMYETAMLISDRLPTTNEYGPVKGAFLVAGDEFTDALSVSEEAAYAGMPIFLVPKGSAKSYDSVPGLKDRIQRFKNADPDNFWLYLTNKGISDNFMEPYLTKQIIVDNTIVKIGNVSQLGVSTDNVTAGSKWLNNLELNYQLNEFAEKRVVLFATGNRWEDGLTGSSLAGKYGAPIVFIGDDIHKTLQDVRDFDQLCGIYTSMDKAIYLGGTAVVPDGAAQKVVKW